MSSLSIPGKVFLIGEYAVLQGLPAVIAAVPPRFSLGPEESAPGVSQDTSAPDIHPQSPAGKLLAEAPAFKLPFRFIDPWNGAGGLGASTAQFALVYRTLGQELGWDQSWEAVWRRYRELAHDATQGGVPPSGADLATQWLGGIVKFQIDARVSYGEASQRSFGAGFDWSAMMVFSATHQAGRKTATHHHLNALPARGFAEVAERLSLSLELALGAGERGDLAGFGQAMELYADELRECGLEVTATREDRAAFRKLPGVYGVKGTGAHQSDAVIVLADRDPACRARILETARARDLRLVTGALVPEGGIR